MHLITLLVMAAQTSAPVVDVPNACSSDACRDSTPQPAPDAAVRTFVVLPFECSDVDEAAATSARDAVVAEWQSTNPASVVVAPALTAAGPCRSLACSRIEHPIDVVIAGEVVRDDFGLHLHVVINDGDATGHGVSAVRSAASDAELAGAAVAAFRLAHADLAAPRRSPAAAPDDDDDDGHADADVTPADDIVMLAVAYSSLLIVLVPGIGFLGLLVVPLLQAGAYALSGPHLVKQQYPGWVAGVFAGYGMLVAGLVATIATAYIAFAVIGSGGLNGIPAQVVLFGSIISVAAVFALAEPVVFHVVVRFGRTPVPPAQTAWLVDEERDARPVLTSTWAQSVSSAPAWR